MSVEGDCPGEVPIPLNPNPNATNKYPNASGNSAYNVVLFEKQRTEYASEEIKVATPTGSATKDDPMHRAPSFVVNQISRYGRTFALRGGDGSNNTITQMLGGMNGKPGVFEWIINSKLELTHQRFIPDGRITGTPNQTPSKFFKED